METVWSAALIVLGAVISFLTARYWMLQATAAKEAARLAEEHAKLADRVIELESAQRLLVQDMKRFEELCGIYRSQGDCRDR